MVKEKLLSEVAEELQKGIELLPLNNQHWVGYTLNDLAKKPVGYLQGWLLTVKALHTREKARVEGM